MVEFIREKTRYHSWTIGASQSGKSTGMNPEILDAADAGDTAIVVVSPAAHDLGTKVFGYLDAAGHTSRIIYDRLDERDRVLQWNLLRPGADEIEQELVLGAAGDVITRARELDLVTAPLIREWFEAYGLLVMNQRIPISPSEAIKAFYPNHPIHKIALENCTNPEAVWKYRTLPRGLIALRKEIGPIERLLLQTIGSPIVRRRESHSNWLLPALEQKRIIIVEGGLVSEIAIRTILSLIIILVIQCVREYFTRTGRPLRVLLVIDEAANYKLIGRWETAVGINQCLKMGLEMRIITQTLFEDEFVNDALFNSCNRIDVYRCGSWRIAEVLSHHIAKLDPYLIHHTEARNRQIQTGWETVDVETRTSSFDDDGDPRGGSTSISKRERPKYEQTVDYLNHYYSLKDQFILNAAEIQRFKVGERGVYYFGQTFREQLPQPEEPWIFPEITNQRIAEAYSRMKSLPVYQNPVTGGSGVPRLPSSSESTRLPSSKSSGSSKKQESHSPLTKLLRDGLSGNGNGGGQP